MALLDQRVPGDPDAVIAQLRDTLESERVEVLVSRLWDERPLAFPIKGQVHGVYFLVYFHSASTDLPAIQRALRWNRAILRFLITKVEPQIVDAMLAVFPRLRRGVIGYPLFS